MFVPQSKSVVCSRRTRTLNRMMALPMVEELEVRCLLTVTMAPQAIYAVNNDPASIVQGVFGPGANIDIITSSNTTDLSFLAGNGDGTFNPFTNIATGFVANQLVAANLAPAGNLDLVATDLASNSIGILIGNGNGTFKAAAFYALTGAPGKPYVADVNGDGFPDIIVPIPSKDVVSVLLGNGNGTFKGAISYQAGTAPIAVAAGDFEADGFPDLVVADQGASPGVSILLNNGNGTFGVPTLTPLADKPYSVAIADLTGDFAPDILVSAGSVSTGVVYALINYGFGDAEFEAPQSFTTGNLPQDIVTGDLNGDGQVDVVTANESGGTVSVLQGIGDGAFQAATPFTVGGGPESAVVADFNGDGRSDIASANYTDGTVSVLLNTGTFTPTLSPPTLTSPVNFSTVTPGTVGGIGGNTVRFNWTAVAGARSYTLDISSFGFLYYTFTSFTNTDSISDLDFTTGEAYQWEVQAVNSTGTAGLPSTAFNFNYGTTALPGATPVTPGTSIAPGPTVTSLTPTFLWDAVASASSYTLNIYQGVTDIDTITGLTGTTQALPSGVLTNSTNYSWNVTTTNIDSVVGTVGPTLYFTTPAAVPVLAGPTVVLPANDATVASETPTLTWDAVNGASRYELFLTSNGTLIYSNDNISGTSFTVPAGYLVAATNYFWNMSTVNAAGVDGAVGNTLAFATPSPAPILPGPTILAPGTPTYSGQDINTLTPTFTWTAVPNATRYGLYLGINGGNLVYFNRELSGTSFTLPSGTISNGETYAWYMITFNSDGVAGSAQYSLLFSTPAPAPVLPGPVLLSPGTSTNTGASVSTLTPTLTWTPVIGAATYLLTMTTGGNTIYTNNDITGSSFAMPTGFLDNGFVYSWTMVTVNADGVAGSTSAPLIFQTASTSAQQSVGPFVVLNGTVLSVVGTTLSDTIELSGANNQVYATMNGMVSASFPAAGLTQIIVDGNAGDDTITIDASAPSVSVQGGQGNDTIVGNNANDTLCGGQGNDSIQGGPGEDVLRGGMGGDTVLAGSGNDSLFGGAGYNVLWSGPGNDTLTVGYGPSILYGGSGTTLFNAADGSADTLFGGTGTNIANLDPAVVVTHGVFLPA